MAVADTLIYQVCGSHQEPEIRKDSRYVDISDVESPLGRGGRLVRLSNRRISRSSFSMPCGVGFPEELRHPCLSKRYAKRFFLSSGRPANRVNNCASSCNTNCAAMIDAAAASRTTRDESELVSVSA